MIRKINQPMNIENEYKKKYEYNSKHASKQQQ